jgi:crossover junction endodeoxyribonuclease RusA
MDARGPTRRREWTGMDASFYLESIMEVSFIVQGTPIPKGSMRVVPTQRGPRVVYSSRVAHWENLIREAALAAIPQHWPVDASIEIDMVFVLPRPKYHRRPNGTLREKYYEAPHMSHPDLDKLARAVLDALTGIAWRDDSQVGYMLATKEYGDVPGCQIYLWTVGRD